MTDHDDYELIPVPRNRLFVLLDGTFVVQWEEHRVQDLLDGRYRPYSTADYGSEINNWELEQLRKAGIIAAYDDALVQVCASPSLTTEMPSRAYYLHTTLAKSLYPDVVTAIAAQGLEHRFSVRVQDQFVVIRGKNGVPFKSFDEAEKARETLLQTPGDVLAETVVAFVEIVPTS